MILVFAVAGVPVWRLTRSASAAIVPSETTPDAVPAKAMPLEVEADFAPAPVQFTIKNLDQSVLAGSGPQARFTGRWAGAVPKEGVDLVFQARWPTSETPKAARVRVQFPDGRNVEKSFWAGANGSVEEAFTLPGAVLSP